MKAPNVLLTVSKALLGVVLGLLPWQRAAGFSNTGPALSWQTGALDYGTRYFYRDIELGAPQDFGEGARLNVPILTYGFDPTFLAYFGSDGVAAVNQAMAELNSLPNASSANLSKFLMQDNEAVNYSAQAVGVSDLKSGTLNLMLEHMGLMGETHVFDLRVAAAIPSTTCEFEYAVLLRNFNPVFPYDETPYVNGVLYSYSIVNGCPIGVGTADAIEYPANLATGANFTYTAVATVQSLKAGGYYLGLTRDDVGGIAYLYNPNNFAYETLPANVVVTAINSVSTSSSAASSIWNPLSLTNTTSTNSSTNVVTTNVGTPTVSITNISPGLFGGVGKITYVRIDYNPVTGLATVPVTYSYTMPYYNGNGLQQVRLTRTVTTPDIIFSATDLLSGPATFPITPTSSTRGFSFVASPVLPSIAGEPSQATISTTETVAFNNISPYYYNYNPNFLDQATSATIVTWGSFNGTTNTPVVYPVGSSVQELVAQALSGGVAPPSTNTVWNPIALVNTDLNLGEIGDLQQ